MTTMLSSTVQLIAPQISSILSRKRPRHTIEMVPERSKDEFLQELELQFKKPSSPDLLLSYSAKLHKEYQSRLEESNISMLPSFNHTLPTGEELGSCLALDVGGSTFRVALIQLSSRKAHTSMEVKHTRSYEIDDDTKALQGQIFFDWMADRIGDTLAAIHTEETLLMGLAWSFPIEQTSARSGKLLAMGKGFRATVGLEGQDLSEIIMRSCRAKNLPVEMRAIVNDAAATLLSQAYLDASARMSLILGTGMNSAVYLPVSSVASEKYGVRPASWHAVAQHVLVNTELSMFGKGIMPVTRWDNALNAEHRQPGFQPMEYLIGGLYLGEIVRLVLNEAIDTAGLFNGERPEGFDRAYALSTRTIAAFEDDSTPDLASAASQFLRKHQLRTKPSKTDLRFVQTVVRYVSARAQSYLATAIHALWTLRNESEGISAAAGSCNITVACNGTVIEKYPNFRHKCQAVLDQLCTASGASAGAVSLEMAPESSIYGAAVAVSCIKEG